jgi:hypothetical protein
MAADVAWAVDVEVQVHLSVADKALSVSTDCDEGGAATLVLQVPHLNVTLTIEEAHRLADALMWVLEELPGG